MLGRAQSSFAENTRSEDSAPDEDSPIGICQIWKSPKGTSGCLLGNGVLMFDSVKKEFQILISRQGLGNLSIHELQIKNNNLYIYFCSPDNRKSKGVPFSNLAIRGISAPENELVVVRVDKKEKFEGVSFSSAVRSAKWSRGDEVSCYCVKESSPGLFKVEHYKDLKCNFNPKKSRLYVDVPSTNSLRLVVGSLILNVEKEVLGLLESEVGYEMYYVNTIQAVDVMTADKNLCYLIKMKNESADLTLKQHHQNLETRATDKGYVFLPNKPENKNCLFDALADQLQSTPECTTAKELREKLVQYLEDQHKAGHIELEAFVDPEQPWLDYLEEMRKDGTLGDHLIVQAFSNCYKRPVRVISSLSDYEEILITPVPSPEDHVEPLVLGHVTGSHFISLNKESEKDSPSNSQQHLKLVKEMVEDTNLMHRLSLHLDRSNRASKNYEHLGSFLGVPADVLAKCKNNTEHSPTEKMFDLLGARREELKVASLIETLRRIPRNDVVGIIKQHISDAEAPHMTVCDAIKEKPELLDGIATKLDAVSLFNNNWFRVGRCLKLSAKELDDLQCGTNSTLLLMKYIYSYKPDVTLGKFKEMMTGFERNDVLRVLQDLSEDKSQHKMSDIIHPESKYMASICRCLNKSVPLKGWKNVAYDLNVPREIYEEFNSKQLESPTKMLFQWLSQSKPDLTLGQLCVALRNIGRMDVVLMLKGV